MKWRGEDADHDRYYTQHAVCPKCGGGCDQNLGGFIVHDWSQFQDTNVAACDCGWHGVVHDLVPSWA